MIYIGNTQITDPRCNNTALTQINVNNSPVFRKGTINVSVAISTNFTELNQTASRIYLKFKNKRTGQTIEVGKALGTRTGSLQAIDGDVVDIDLSGMADGYLENSRRNPVILGDGANEFTYPIDASAVNFSVNIQYKGYRGEGGSVWAYEGQTGTCVISPEITIRHDED